MQTKIISKKETSRKANLSETTIWREVRAGRFPQPLQLSPRRVGWLVSDVDSWIERKVTSERPKG